MCVSGLNKDEGGLAAGEGQPSTSPSEILSVFSLCANKSIYILSQSQSQGKESLEVSSAHVGAIFKCLNETGCPVILHSEERTLRT